MEHFAQVYDVCRVALAGDTKQARAAVKALRAALESAGETEDAQFLDRLLKAVAKKDKSSVVHFVQSQTSPCPYCSSTAITLREDIFEVDTRYGKGTYRALVSACEICQKDFLTPEQCNEADAHASEVRRELKRRADRN